MTNDELTLLAMGKVPAEPILTAILEHVERADFNRDHEEVGELRLLCERQDLEYGHIAKILYRFKNPDNPEGPVKALDFDIADKLLCGADMCDRWRGDLHDYYYGVDLSWHMCEAEGCNTMFRIEKDTLGRFKHQKYCSPGCSRSAYKMRKGRTRQRLPITRRGKMGRPVGVLDRTPVCRNGHTRTDENTMYRPNGKMECLDCHRASSKRAYDRKMQAKREAAIA